MTQARDVTAAKDQLKLAQHSACIESNSVCVCTVLPSGPLAGVAIEKTLKLLYKRTDLRFFCIGLAGGGKRVLHTAFYLIAVLSCLT